MTERDALSTVIAGVNVRAQDVTVAKAYLLRHFKPDTEAMIEGSLIEFDAVMPKVVNLNESQDLNPSLARMARAVSWRLTIYEAVWQLVHSNAFLPTSSDFTGGIPHVTWTTGRTSSGWDLDGHIGRLIPRVPRMICMAPSWNSQVGEMLVDGDLYLHSLAIPGLHPEVGI